MSRLLAPAPTRRARMVAPALTLGGLAAATVALHVRDPHASGSWGICPTAALGFSCPGCGGLRAVNDLTHLDLAAAASSNLVLVVAIPFVLLGLARWTADRWRGRERQVDWQAVQPLVLVGIALLVVFTVLRNLPAGTWLAP